MKILKTINKWIISVPNMPFMLMVALYVLYNIVKETGIAEMEFLDKNNLITPEIKEHIRDIYPKWMMFLIAFVFYLVFGVKLLDINIL